MRSFIKRLFTGLLSVSLVLSSLPIADALSSYTWNVSTVYEGGYDYTETYLTEDYIPSSTNETWYINYREIEGAEIIEGYDMEVDADGNAHVLFGVEKVGIMYATRAAGTTTWDYTKIYSNIHYSSGVPNINMYTHVELELDSKGQPHVMFDSIHEGLWYGFYDGSRWYKWTYAYPLQTHAHHMDVLKMRMDAHDDIHVVYDREDLSWSTHLVYEVFGTPSTSGISLPVPSISKTIDSVLSDGTDPHPPTGWDNVDFEFDSSGESHFVYLKYTDHPRDHHESISYALWDGSNMKVNPGSFDAWPYNDHWQIEVVNDVPYVYSTKSNTVLQMEPTGDALSDPWFESDMIRTPSSTSFEFDIRRTENEWNLAAIEKDGTGNYSLSLINYSDNQLQYYTHDVLDTGLVTSNSVDLEFTNLNDPFILYMNDSGPGYLKLIDITPESIKIDKNGRMGMYSDLALDQFGLPHVAYYDELSEDLKYAFMDHTGVWTIETVDYSGVVGLYPSIDVDESTGDVHISYYSEEWSSGSVSKNLKHAVRHYKSYYGYVWDIQDVHVTGFVGMHSDILVDNGTVHITYYDETNTDLLYIYSTLSAGSVPYRWSTPEIIDGMTSDVGEYASMDITSTGVLYVSYFDATNKNLKLAYGNAGAWFSQVADSILQSGLYTSLDIDDTDTIHIAYYNAQRDNLKYLQTTPGATINASFPHPSWELVDTPGDVGKYADIATDVDGNPFISYYDDTNGYLKFASKEGGAWVTNNIDMESDTGLYTSLGISDSGRVHLVYYLRSISGTSTTADLLYQTF